MAHIVRSSAGKVAVAARLQLTSPFPALTGALLVMVMMMLAAAPTPADADPKIACPHKDGYQVLPGKSWYAPSGTETKYRSMADAQAACDAADDCVAFNNFRAIIQGAVDDMRPPEDGGSTGTCVYIKGNCAPVSGYTAFNHTTATSVEGGLISGLSSLASSCSGNPACMGFTYGDYNLLAGGYISTQAIFKYSLGEWAQGKCFYMRNDQLKNGCIPKYGYTNLAAKGLSSLSGVSDGAGFGSLAGGAEEAEALCKITPRCSGWDTNGRVAIGGHILADQSTEVCTYTKDPCPPRAGFIAYSGFTDTATKPSRRNVDLCATDLYNACLADGSCKGFDTLRYLWTSKPNPTSSFPGMCTYVRATGF